MKTVLLLLVVILLSASGTYAQKLAGKNHVITVIDMKNGLPVKSAEVTLTSITEARDVYTEVKLTDNSGKCGFNIHLLPNTEYGVFAAKKGYVGYLAMDPVKISRYDAAITHDSPKEIKLYLTSDSMHQVEFYRKTEVRYEIPDLIALLKSGNFHGGIPLLYWNDIPQLLAVGNDMTMISSYPANPLSSSASEAPLGMVALWLIESVRIAEGNRLILPWQRFPSLNPVIRNLNDNDISADIPGTMQKVFEVYGKWWESVKKTDSSHGCRVNPLEGTGMCWQ
jgi:hypothetical protein